MTSPTAVTLRCALLALATMSTASPVAFAADDGKLVSRGLKWSTGAQGAAVICGYETAKGSFDILEFSEHPESVTCAPFASAEARPVSGNHWAAPLPTDKTVELECRFLRPVSDAGNSLGTRFTADAPLRFKVNLKARQLTLASDDDRLALGEAAFRADTWVVFSHGAALRDPPKELTLWTFPKDGQATLLLGPLGAPIWSRPGGCRLGAGG
jgi:hypothetical protein